ncbi:tRNA(1)(Val) (adenine(37)-N(6))-methyltransferase TrmN [Vagococcus sp. WN89Y]|uniref:tRNA(1)(Val) (adenine(37)-N(6))-methyltransferase TrmN n=1 Tax=Vagococcus sp. WN89Y TaxID=3457258 RepID=UPI003FCC6B54
MLSPKAQLRRDGFTFKEFFVAHDRCAMKVGTDGVMLGAWLPVARARHVLDIGTGSGLLALMLAQRTPAQAVIDAVELDAQAAAQAQENAQASPWAQRIHIHHADIRQWSQQTTVRYDLIVSNPPYYDEGVKCATPERDRARYTTTLDHQALLETAAMLITEEGYFCVVLPIETGESFTQKAQRLGWHLRLRTDVSETDSRLPHRVLLAFSPKAGEVFLDRLVIRGPDQRYSQSYTALTQAFYLFM